MREILFRGKRIDDGAWVHGDLWQYESRRKAIFDYTAKTRFFVDPETVSQYTGLKDRNGKQIFDGDIIHRNWTANEGANYIVEFNDGEFELHLAGSDGYLWICKATNGEVIGNIHDNTELLKGGKL